MHEILKKTRNRRKYTSTYMAKKLGITLAFYSQLENEKRSISYEMAVKIANILNVEPDYLFYKETKKRIG